MGTAWKGPFLVTVEVSTKVITRRKEEIMASKIIPLIVGIVVGLASITAVGVVLAHSDGAGDTAGYAQERGCRIANSVHNFYSSVADLQGYTPMRPPSEMVFSNTSTTTWTFANGYNKARYELVREDGSTTTAMVMNLEGKGEAGRRLYEQSYKADVMIFIGGLTLLQKFTPMTDHWVAMDRRVIIDNPYLTHNYDVNLHTISYTGYDKILATHGPEYIWAQDYDIINRGQRACWFLDISHTGN